MGKEESFDCRYCEETLYNISLRMGTQGSTRDLPHSGWRVFVSPAKNIPAERDGTGREHRSREALHSSK